ncbi:MAG: sugar phosphate nucleotidyltransferase [Anaerolineae bacterium]|jgi:UTP--glucose-1-phosphate uridylyltransferase|nr:sugar phosphate nucleotidyltransferase [Anaerolineae bacterium]
MKITKAVITAAGPKQRSLPLQTLVDCDGAQKSVLRIILEEARRAGIDDICVVVSPGDEGPYAEAAGDVAARLTFVAQTEPRGYGDAVLRARPFTGDEPFLHLVGDHLWVSGEALGCAEQLVKVAEQEACLVSAVQASRETLLPYYGTVGGRRLPGRHDLYLVEDVMEKPTPTEAEQRLLVPGLRAGHYLCFFGMHVLTPGVMSILDEIVSQGSRGSALSKALAIAAQRERYLALERAWFRYDVGVQYGLLTAQLALALSGKDRALVLSLLLELLAHRQMGGGQEAA